ncbi:MAG: hypothetical protein LAN64_10675 [Acidobacteriia bacterium]|nr:hypothetical protein [Terriglobia bacterium]
MQRQAYLGQSDVLDFVSWLSNLLTKSTPKHQYSEPRKASVTFDGLWGARDKYKWKFSFKAPGGNGDIQGSSYMDNDKALTVLKNGLTSALSVVPPGKADVAARDWAKAIMKWGGVTSGNAKWLDANSNGLAKRLADTRSILSLDDDEVTDDRVGRFTVGMSKAYSLLVDKFIIYDSRVAATLAWLVALWCQETSRACVPPLLRVGCLPAKEGENAHKLRNPSCTHFSFPWVNNSPAQHVRWNLRGSWILSSALASSKEAKFHADTQPLRALEAAFFMWGYDVAGIPACSVCHL